MKIFDFFDEIWCINLDHRTDRWKNAQKEFDKLNIKDKVNRFSAIKKDDGRIGVIKSVLNILKYAKEKNLNNILIFEDDIKFLNVDNFENILNNSINQLPDNWQLFYLGANLNTKNNKYSDNLVQLKNAYAAHSIAYNKNIFNKIIYYAEDINRINNIKDVYDVFLTKIQNNNLSFATHPLLSTQLQSYSDIEKCHVNYDFIEERFKNNVVNNKK